MLKLSYRNVSPHRGSEQAKFLKLHWYWRPKQLHFHPSSKPLWINCLTEQKPVSSILRKAIYFTYSISSKILSQICFHLCLDHTKFSVSYERNVSLHAFLFFPCEVLCVHNRSTEPQELSYRLPATKNKHYQTPRYLETHEQPHLLSNFEFLD